jgi:hypothetical protein
MVLKTAAIAFLVGLVLLIGVAIWQANDPSDDIFQIGPQLCPSGTELHDTGHEASRACVPVADDE